MSCVKFSKFGVHLTKQQAIVGEKLSEINAMVIKSDEGHGPKYKIFISLCRQNRQISVLFIFRNSMPLFISKQ